MNAEDADLWFGPNPTPGGFTSAALAQFDGSAEPVVRELIQNSLDAAQQAGREAVVRFEICEIPKSELPGCETYEKTLARAKTDRERWHKGKPSHDEATVIKRIDSTLSTTIPVLFCIDNGYGLNSGRMNSLLTMGNTSKGDSGAGSFGLGHYAAFGASDLRYVLYASKYRDQRNEVARIASGHAILASHLDRDGERRTGDGYWFNIGQTVFAFDDSTDSSYPAVPPGLLASRLDTLADTGTVVCIAGFNDFRCGADDPSSVLSICRVAASNFSDAVHSAGMLVTARDERAGRTEEREVTRQNLESLLEPISSQRQAKKRGQISGSVAHSAASTLKSDKEILGLEQVGLEGSRIRWRYTVGDDRPVTQVHIFRKGMWITSRADPLTHNNFSKNVPFDAVLSLDSGPLEQLVRNAEGPEHRGLDRRRLVKKQKKHLRELLAEVHRLLQDNVKKRQDLDEYTPPGFASFKGKLNRKAETVRRARPPSGGGKQKHVVIGGEEEGNASKDPERQQGTPRGGSVPSYKYSLSATSGVPRVEVLVRYDEETTPKSHVGVRIRAVSGSDASCANPLPDRFLRVTRIDGSSNGAPVSASDPDGDLEILVPLQKGTSRLKLRLAEPIDDPEVIEIDLVRRKPPPDQRSLINGTSNTPDSTKPSEPAQAGTLA